MQIVQEYERAVIFRLGRLLEGGTKGPGQRLLCATSTTTRCAAYCCTCPAFIPAIFWGIPRPKKTYDALQISLNRLICCMGVTVNSGESRYIRRNRWGGTHWRQLITETLIGSWDGSVAEWSACWPQEQKSPGSNRSRDAVLRKLFTPIVPLFTKQQNW